ncbi:MAG: methyl-accepting chemotaxis protein [Desulfobulbaceae bacterium]|nr:methyl-accepting chemotaxis protein [Desulfobulbaceae bacterium]
MKYNRSKLNLKIKRQFQMWLLSRIVGTILLSSLVAAAILFLYARQEVGNSFYEAHIKIRYVSDLLIPVVLAGSLVSLISGTLLAIFLPQKIAGPIFRIEEDLKYIQNGHLDKKITLREGDPLHDFAETINTTLAVLKANSANKEQ